jgi:uncharacterized membrane protein YbhN (UPF0104 family)
MIDMMMLTVIALAGLAAYGPLVTTEGWISVFWLIAAVAACVLAVVLVARRSTASTGLRARVHEALPAPAIIVKVGILSIVGWTMVACAWQSALLSVGISLSIGQSAWLVAVVAITQFASLIPAGVGASDVVAIQLLQFWGANPDRALAGAIALRAMGLLMIGIAFVHWEYWILFGSWLWSRAAGKQGKVVST